MRCDWQLPSGRKVDLAYFVTWRSWLWNAPVCRAVRFLGDLEGRSVLEIGGKNGRMASLLALQGAQVTMVDLKVSSAAQMEVDKWGVADRVRLLNVHGLWEELRGETFDAVFTKSVLCCLIDMPALFPRIDECLAPGGRVVFLENYRGGKLFFRLKKMLGGTGPGPAIYKGVTREQLALFRRQFANVKIRRHLFLVWEILGHKRTGVAQPAASCL